MRPSQIHQLPPNNLSKHMCSSVSLAGSELGNEKAGAGKRKGCERGGKRVLSSGKPAFLEPPPSLCPGGGGCAQSGDSAVLAGPWGFSLVADDLSYPSSQGPCPATAPSTTQPGSSQQAGWAVSCPLHQGSWETRG